MAENAPGALDPVIGQLVDAFERKMNVERSTQVILTLHQFIALHVSRLIEHSFVHADRELVSWGTIAATSAEELRGPVRTGVTG